MIKNIVFDMGQVLIKWNPEDMLTHYALSPEEMKQLNTELFKSVEWIQGDRGILSEDAIAEKVCARLPEKLHGPVRTLVYGWHQRHLLPMPGMGELVQELKGEGYRIFLLSNANLAVRDYFHRIPGAECFEQLMISAEEKLLKPMPEIYHRLYEKFNLDPAECWFIDDSPANIEAAIYTGMQGTIFRGDTARLRRELKAGGIRCTAEE